MNWKDPEEVKEYWRKLYLKNREKIIQTEKKYQQGHKEEVKQRKHEYYLKHKDEINNKVKKYRKLNPWMSSYYCAKNRCNNPKNKKYKQYGGRGIKTLMTPEDFKYLWFRDKAYFLKKASIDRIDNDGNYELENCRFIELSENVKRKKGTKYKKIRPNILPT